MNRREFIANAAAVAVALAAAPLAVASGCTCGGLWTGSNQWCDDCLACIGSAIDGMEWPQDDGLQFNRTPTSGREIMARYDEAQRILDVGLKPSTLSRVAALA